MVLSLFSCFFFHSCLLILLLEIYLSHLNLNTKLKMACFEVNFKISFFEKSLYNFITFIVIYLLLHTSTYTCTWKFLFQKLLSVRSQDHCSRFQLYCFHLSIAYCFFCLWSGVLPVSLVIALLLFIYFFHWLEVHPSLCSIFHVHATS